MQGRSDTSPFVGIAETLVGPRAGGVAAGKARELRHADPVGALLSTLLGLHASERVRRRGSAGERTAGFPLGRLPEGWRVLHDVPVGERDANIEHVVVGPAGAFTLEVKNLTGEVWIGPGTILHNGQRTDYLPKAAHEARRASRLLSAALGRSVDVHGVIVILADDWTIEEWPVDVHVGSPRGVRDWLIGLPAALTPHEVMELAGVASTPSTWTAALARS